MWGKETNAEETGYLEREGKKGEGTVAKGERESTVLKRILKKGRRYQKRSASNWEKGKHHRSGTRHCCSKKRPGGNKAAVVGQVARMVGRQTDERSITVIRGGQKKSGGGKRQHREKKKYARY